METFLHVLRRKGDVVNTVVAVATAKALIVRTLDEHLKCLDLDFLYWDMSQFRRMDFMKQTCTISKPEIPKLTKKEAKLIQASIPLSLVMNFHQIPLKYDPFANQTLSSNGSKHVALKGVSLKKSITATFGITFNLKFLPIQHQIDEGTCKYDKSFLAAGPNSQRLSESLSQEEIHRMV